MPPGPSRRPCPSGKQRYPSRKFARFTLTRLRAAAKAGDTRRRETHLYPCDTCRGWHLTSQRPTSTQETQPR
ncbi:hypothetical protein ACU686_40385 [Yinghuangia aomiensis]